MLILIKKGENMRGLKNLKRNCCHRIFALVLSLALVLSNTTAFASETDAEPLTQTETQTEETESSAFVEAAESEETAEAEKTETTETETKTELNTEAVAESKEETTSAETKTEEEIQTETETETELETETETETEEEENAVSVSSFSSVNGWNESIYAEIAGVSDADVKAVSYSGTISGSLTGDDLEYLVRDNGNDGVRIDIPGLKAGTYTLTVEVGSSKLEAKNITVYKYDRSGYAHFNYTNGVGAYNDDGTLKDNAVVLYVTDENKNTVELTVGNTTVTGIGNILNSVGENAGNSNQGIIKKLAEAGTPLVVRFIGTVSESGLYKPGTFDASNKGLIDGLTIYASAGNGGSADDNGHMARMRSGKDITLEGIGYDAVIDGWGFHFMAESSAASYGKSFEVRNLTFINTPEDAIGMEGVQESKNASSSLTASVERCWIHNNEFYCPQISNPAESDKSEGDGSVDFKRGQYFTCSYNYFEGCHKTNLVGSADYSLQYNLTYHHNYWYMCKARGPLTRRANVHMYNNVVDMQTDYAQNTRADAYIFSEYNLFYACKNPQSVEGGAIKSYNDSIASIFQNNGSTATVVTNKTDKVENNCQFISKGIDYSEFDTNSSLSYIPNNNYELQTDFTDLRKVIVSQAGVQERNPKLASEVTSNDYSVIERSGAQIQTFTSLPQELTPGKISKTTYAFTVETTFNLEVEYSSTVVGVLVNEAGENLLEGNGSVIQLPAGTYMLQAVTFQPGNYLNGTKASFKDMTISSLNITAYDPNAHYHVWELDTDKSTAATCTEEGKNVYKCVADGECDGSEKTETVAALGHSYGSWVVEKEATDTEAGQRYRVCTVCNDKQAEEIPIGEGSGNTGGNTGGSTAAGDYVLYFTGKTNNGNTDFFTTSNVSYSDAKGSATVNGTEYSVCVKMESKTAITFDCNEGASLFMAFGSAETGKGIKVDGNSYITDSNATVTVSDLSTGTHTITKDDTINLFYVSVTNAKAEEIYYLLTFDYNYDGAPDEKEIEAVSGASYADMSALTPSGFTRSGYTLKGLYYDADCTKEVTYPYTVSGDAAFFAAWEENKSSSDDNEPDNGEDNKGDDDNSGDDNDDSNSRGIQIVFAKTSDGKQKTYSYTGAKVIPEFEIRDYDIDSKNGKLLSQGVDYTIKYTNNTNPTETANVSVTGKGNYTGKNLEGYFTIVKKEADASLNLESLKGAKLGTIAAQKYHFGNEIYPASLTLTLKGGSAVTYKYSEEKGTYITDDTAKSAIPAVVAFSNNVNKGTATILLTGTNDTKIKKTFKITAVDFEEGKVSIKQKSDSGETTDTLTSTYAVKGAVPENLSVTYKNGDKDIMLKEGTDYTVKYSANKKAGTTGKLIITGKGNYAKKLTKVYTIGKLDLSAVTVSTVTAYDGIKAGKVMATVLDGKGNALKASQYQLKVYKDAEGTMSYSPSDKLTAGAAIYVEASAKDNNNLEAASTTPKAAFTVGKNIAKATVKDANTGKSFTKTYTGKPITIAKGELEVKLKDVAEPLVLGTDYEIEYSNNINKGTAIAYIKGIGKYSGTKTVKFKITAKKIK